MGRRIVVLVYILGLIGGELSLEGFVFRREISYWFFG